jgi:hypothetical protein
MTVTGAQREGRVVLSFVQEVKSEGPFAWLFRYRVDNRLAATWDPSTGCSYGLDKKLRQGRFARDQRVRIDPDKGRVEIEQGRYPVTVFNVAPWAAAWRRPSCSRWSPRGRGFSPRTES